MFIIKIYRIFGRSPPPPIENLGLPHEKTIEPIFSLMISQQDKSVIKIVDEYPKKSVYWNIFSFRVNRPSKWEALIHLIRHPANKINPFFRGKKTG